MDGIAYLILPVCQKDELGQMIPSGESKTEIYVTEKSVTGTEWHEAGRDGINAQIVLKTPYINYNGEEVVEYNGKRYGVYRTYRPQNSDVIELYLEKKAGVS